MLAERLRGRRRDRASRGTGEEHRPEGPHQRARDGKFAFWSTGDVTFPKADGVFWHNSRRGAHLQSEPNQDWKDADVAFQNAK